MASRAHAPRAGSEPIKPSLNINLLRTFHAVARLGQFRAAAEHVHRSHAAVSVHIQRLEAIAGGRLLERDNQAVSLTPLGERLLTATTDLLRAHDKVLDELHGTTLVGRIKVGVPDEYATHLIRDILPLFSASWTNVVLEVTTAPSLALRELIDRNRVQLAICAQALTDHPHPHALLTTTPVWVAGIGANGPLPDPVPLALHATHCPYRSEMTSSLEKAGRTWREVLSSPSSQAIQACVEAGLGVSLIDRSRVTASMRRLDGMPRVAAHEILLLRASDPEHDPATSRLAQTIREHFTL